MIGDSVTMQYMALKDCDLTTLKEIFNTVYFGFVLPKADNNQSAIGQPNQQQQQQQQRPRPSNEDVSNAIINLGQRGDLDLLYEKWWPKKK